VQYPHWLIVVGTVLVAVGFIGLSFQRNRAERISDNPERTLPNDEANRAMPMLAPSERIRAARASVSAAAELKAKGK